MRKVIIYIFQLYLRILNMDPARGDNKREKKQQKM